jgi:4-diphosphocytidyl-2-C-methyl-D-erythritol kinase
MKGKLAMACTIEAPCKINLHLSVGEKRPDGFHELESLFAPLDFHDTLRLECGGKDGECSLEMNRNTPIEVIPPVIPVEENLVFRAVSLFRERTGFGSGLFLRLDKRVPVGAGLGGGSSDAASCLLALNSLAGDVLSMEELSELAAVLGSDIPFFLGTDNSVCPPKNVCPSDRNVCPPADLVCPPAAYVGGRGELVRPVKTPRGLWVLLVKPDFSSDTAAAFRLLDQMRPGDRFYLSPGEGRPGDRFHQGDRQYCLSPQKKSLIDRQNPPVDDLITALGEAPETWPFYNDFLPVFLASGDHQNADQYRVILATLKDAGASFSGLSGAGSCCFGVFREKETAEKAGKRLAIPGNFVKLTFFLAKKTIPVLE